MWEAVCITDSTDMADWKEGPYVLIIDEDGLREETEERICNSCWLSDLSKYEVENL